MTLNLLNLTMIIILRAALRGEGQLSSTLATETGQNPGLARHLLPAHLSRKVPVHVFVMPALQTFLLLCQVRTEPARLP